MPVLSGARTESHLPLEHEISVTGHADLVETQNGEWWMVLLGGRIYLTVAGDENGYHIYYGNEDQEKIPVFSCADPTLLSTLTNEGFTGTYLGMYATSNHLISENHVDFDWVVYEAV